MKKLSFLILVALTATSAFSQSSNLEMAITENLNLLESAKTIQDVKDVVNRFERIAMAEPERWEPLYHYAYSQIQLSFWERDGNVKDKILDQAEINISKAFELKGDRSELFTLKGFLCQGRINANASRGMIYSRKAAEAFGTAVYENPENPRALFLWGMNIRHTPVGFGGGCVNALPKFLEAKALFEKENGKPGILPRWGARSNMDNITDCSDKK